MKQIAFDTMGLNAEMLRPPKVTARQHHHQEIELNYLFSGGVTYLHQWRRRRLPLGRLVAFWGSAPHCIVAVEPGSEMAWVTVPLPWLLQWKLPAAFIRRLLEGEWCEEARDAEAPERYPVRAWVEEIRAGEKAANAAILLELQAALVRMSAAQRRREPGANEADGTGWRHVEAMARFMAEHYAEEIDLEAIAAAAGLHPKYATTLFRKWCGLTPHDYLLQHRVTHAQRLLITTDAKVIDVALASGFGSLSAFYEVFQRVTRTTPGKLRKLGG
ncbi:MAG: helix-turn-helix domain-containing protein [Opitutaceae bacterium]|nr:helix-turn-helix domain-containing protein [Opitutaceae bacterium]